MYWSRAALVGTVVLTTCLCACSNDDTDDSSDSDAVSDVTTQSDGSNDACPAAGTWEVTAVTCAGNEVWEDVQTNGQIDSITVVINEADGGGCDYLVTVSGSQCEEDSAGTTDADLNPTSAAGITRCDPDACVFVSGDEPCVVGDRAGEDVFVLGDPEGNQIEATSSAPAGLCGGFGVDTTLTLSRR